jgi:hypothetical protein
MPGPTGTRFTFPETLVEAIMETYTSDVPALAPLASGTLETMAPAIKKGDPIHADHLVASKRQLEWRETIAKYQPRSITNEELVAAERRFHVLNSLHFDVVDGEHIPRWALQLREEFRESQRRTEQAVQRSMNRGLKSTYQDLEPVIRLVDGTFPQDFPATVDDFMRVDEASIDEWLLFYDLQRDGTRLDKEKRLKEFWGVHI